MERSRSREFFVGIAGVFGIVVVWWNLQLWEMRLFAHIVLVVSIIALIVAGMVKQRPFLALGAGFGTAVFLAVGACFVIVYSYAARG